MDISIENIHKRMINPVWTSSHNHVSAVSANMWPIRQQSHSRRFYTTPKPRRSYIIESQFQPELAPITLKVDADQFNKQKSMSSMAFCSTSKVKYMPLQGLSQDGLASLKWSGQCPGLFPVISRPTSRPIILHGRRYTTLAIEDERSCTRLSSNTKEEDKVSQRVDNFSDQRRRFNEAERYKFSTKFYKETTETSQYKIKRNYCLSGHKMFIKSSKETIDEKLNRLQPILNLDNRIRKKKDSASDRKTNTIEGDGSYGNSAPINGQISHRDINESIISVDIVSGKKEEIGTSSVTDAVKSALMEAKKVNFTDELLAKAKEWLRECLLGQMEDCALKVEEGNITDTENTSTLWNILLPKVEDVDEDLEPMFLFQKLIDIEPLGYEDVEIFLSKMFDPQSQLKEISFWSKILALLKTDKISAKVFVNISRLIRIFQYQTDEEEVSRETSLGRICFWVQIFSMMLSAEEGSSCLLSNYLETLIKIIVNRNPLDEYSEMSIQKMVESFLHSNLQLSNIGGGDIGTTMIQLTQIIETIPWIFNTHNTIFHRPLSLEDFATTLTILTDNFHK